jgi:hypothetical protein
VLVELFYLWGREKGEEERRRKRRRKKREKRLIRTTVDFNYHVHESNSITLLIQKCMP